MSLHTLAAGLEDSVRALLGNEGFERGANLRSGLGFPTGLCLNHQVAHYTPNPSQPPVHLQETDLLTVDFGVHINGWIVDSAFTLSLSPDPAPAHTALLAAVKNATDTGIRAAGVDVRVSDVSAAIHEAMESWEVEVDGKMRRVRPVRNLSAHNIAQYRIHGGKSIPFVRNGDQTKMDEGEVFAIETFGSTGRGSVVDDVCFSFRYTTSPSILTHSLVSPYPYPYPFPLQPASIHPSIPALSNHPLLIVILTPHLPNTQTGIYGYGLSPTASTTSSLPAPPPQVSLASARRLHATIRDNFGTLVFCRRYLERLGVERYLAGVSRSSLLRTL